MSKMTSQTKHVPKDAQVIISMLKDMGITEYEPRVVNQLLELNIILLEVARAKNNCPLPMIKPHCGIRLPPDRYSLNSCNYKLRNYKKQLSKQNPLGEPISLTSHPRIQLAPGGMMSGNNPMKVHPLSGNIQGSVSKSTSIVSTSSSVSIVNSGGHGRTVALVGKNPGVQQTHKVITLPKPVIKFSAGTPNPSIVPKIQIATGTKSNISTAALTTTGSSSATTTSMAVTSEGSGGIKRKREDDYDIPD